MNIIYVSGKRSWGGGVTWMYRTAVGLEARGHHVWILSHPLSEFTRMAPGDVKIIPKRLGMDYNPAMIIFLAGFMKRRRIDLVVTNIQKEVVIGGLAARICGIPNVRRVGNENDLNDRVRWRQRLLVDHTIVPSDATLRNAAKRSPWLIRGEFTTIYNGVNPAAYSREETLQLRREWGVPPDATVIGSTTRLTGIKGLDGLICAFKQVAEKHGACRLVLAGNGPDRARLEDLAARLGIRERVVFAGFTTDPLRAAAAYDIAVLNSTIEGFPNTVVEYMAVGTAVVSTDVGGVPEIVRDTENGLLIRAGDSGELGRKLLLLVENPDLRQRLGESAIETVRNGFSQDIMIQRTESLFQRIVGRQR